MIRAAVSTPYLRACLNTTRQTTKRFAMSNNPVRTFVAEATIPKLKDSSLFRHAAYVNSEWITSDKTFSVYDPATGKEIGKLPEMGGEDTTKAIQAASEAFKSWSQTTGKQRHDLLKKWYDLTMANTEDLATILTWENGKTYAEAKGEIAYGASFFEWFAEEAVRSYGNVIPSHIPSQRFITIKQPVGVVGVITPWNFPNAMITRKVGAALAAGCTVVIKPGAETPYSALALCELAERAGIPKGVINVVTTHEKVAEVGKELCTNPIVKKISFTGSTGVGKMLMAQSSGTMKKISMELGGNAPFIVFDDADVDAAVEGVLACKFRGTGQTCVCANRIYVQKGIYALFASKLAEKVGKFRVGHGFNADTTHGPLINDKAVEKVKRHIDDAVSKGGELLVGGKHVGGNFIEPAVVANMTQEMAIAGEETFGPVAGLFEFSTEEEVLEYANKTEFGLASYFYSRDIGRIWRVAEKLEAGMVGANSPILSSCYTPFGGIKESGVGREGSMYGMDDYLNIKYINMGGI
ncbi:succinate-semialdehyde dehydrogenase [Lichtheimia corymbifera JMRC:FSU:9682]|uniref:Succinate-semialdehyde dehydrogenase n=1 Tax=Lichtheimia corymbifera JMRC:FSU:9682 TaxID=1263082 RepID=A0A068RYW8_9FUNG|nr:succinate-semialdehyde dehydrogenase [Lichtheimia corymbifera JMRC:FSU:9682]